MSSTVIQVDNLWKKYRLGVLGTGTLRHDLNRWWHRVRGKPDPYAIVGRVQEPGIRSHQLESTSALRPLPSEALGDDEIWALRRVSFEVKRGEILGIIGRNGAGKSTLLKILSRVTAPTKGEVRLKGRIASLLEVGTGFHPELTGRENIFLNGAILGMSKAEIKRKFDEIIAFSEVEKFIDTPVKRYSSGMHVRLAFAVAAHLEPEILIVDEVLAVGDAEFQNKCLGKMRDVSTNEGRTVLFVSHNMGAIQALCTRCVVLGQGRILGDGQPNAVIEKYFATHFVDVVPPSLNLVFSGRQGNGKARFRSVRLGARSSDVQGKVPFGVPIVLEGTFEVLGPKPVRLTVAFAVITNRGDCAFASHHDDASSNKYPEFQPGFHRFSVMIAGIALRPGHYFLSLGMNDTAFHCVDYCPDYLTFEITDAQSEDCTAFRQGRPGLFMPSSLSWTILPEEVIQ